MRRSRILLALLLGAPLVASAPSASACSWALPDDHAELAWAGTDAVWTERHTSAGLLHLENGSFEALVSIFPAFAWAAAPDGTRLAFAYGAARDVPQGGIHGYDTCWQPLGATKLLDVEDDVAAELLPGAASALAAGPRALAVSHVSFPGVRLVPWDGSPPTDLGAKDVAAGAARLLALSPDGRYLAAVSGHEPATLVVIDTTSGARVGGPLAVGAPAYHVRVAFSPDGTRLAVLSWDGERTTVRVLASDGLEETARAASATVGTGLAWGRPGLAVAANLREGGGVVRLHRADLSIATERDVADVLSGVAWSDDGRLAVGGRSALRVLDAGLEPLAEVVVAGDRAPTPRHGAPPHEPAHDVRFDERWVPASAAASAVLALALVALGRASRRR